MSFFLRDNKIKPSNGLKRPLSQKRNRNKLQKSSKDEEILSESDSELVNGDVNGDNLDHSDSDDENLTVQEKRLKLAKIYLDEIKREEERRIDKKEFDTINQRLKDDLLEQTGRLRSNIADKLNGFDLDSKHCWKTKNNRDCITCIVLSKDNNTLYAATKNGVLTIYSLNTKEKIKSITLKKVDNEKLCICDLAISYDNKFLAIAQDKNVVIYNGTTLERLNAFKGHSDIVTGVVFRRESHQLYSASKDRSVKVWSCDEMLYVETLFGHQSSITSIDALYRERAITSGGYDCSIRVWKFAEDSQLVYNGHSGSIDCVKLITEDHFVSGGNDGSLQLWSTHRKKPLKVQTNAHGIDSVNNIPNWIVSIATVLNSDLVASGSYDGFIRLWKISESCHDIVPLLEIPVDGFINSLVFSQNADYLIAAVGREHHLGRWWNKTNVVNSIIVIPLSKR